jgi:hypothetical protein
MSFHLKNPEFWDNYPEYRDQLLRAYSVIEARGQGVLNLLAASQLLEETQGEMRNLDAITQVSARALETLSGADMDRLRELAPAEADGLDLAFNACLSIDQLSGMQQMPYEKGYAVLELIVTELFSVLRAYCRYLKEDREEERRAEIPKFRQNRKLLALIPKGKTFFVHVEGRLPQAVLWCMSRAEARVEDVLAAIHNRKCDFYLADTDAVYQSLKTVD